MKKITAAILAAGLFMQPLFAQKIRDSFKETEMDGRGFYYYDDGNQSTPRKVVKGVTPAQAMQADMTQRLIEAVEENTRVQKAVLKRLEYAFPDKIPEYSINAKTGERCRTNSEPDCFVPPVVTEAQQSMPALAEMIRNPNYANVSNYMQLQSKVLNNAFSIGDGFSLVAAQEGRKAHNVDGTGFTQMPKFGNKQNEVAYTVKSALVKKLGDKIGLMLFVGMSKELERNFSGKEYTYPLNTIFYRQNAVRYVFKSQKDLDEVKRKVDQYEYDVDPERFEKATKMIRPDLYERFNIDVTPTAVLIYRADNGETVWQKIGHSLAGQDLLDMTFRFLRFYKIIEPATINEKDAWRLADLSRAGKSYSDRDLADITIDDSNASLPKSQLLNQKGEQ